MAVPAGERLIVDEVLQFQAETATVIGEPRLDYLSTCDGAYRRPARGCKVLGVMKLLDRRSAIPKRIGQLHLLVEGVSNL